MSSLFLWAVLLIPAAYAADDCEPAQKAMNGGKCPDSATAPAVADENETPPWLEKRTPDAAVYKDNCSDTKMEKPGVMDHIPVRAQGNSGTCFAEAAAVMIDSYRFSHGDTEYKKQSSSFMLALDTGSMEGSYACDAVDAARVKGTCEQDSTFDAIDKLLEKTADGEKKDFGARDRKGYLELLKAFWDEYQYNIKRMRSFSSLRDLYNGEVRPISYAGDRVASIPREVIDCLRKNGFPSEALPPPSLVEALLRQTDETKFMRVITARSCAKHRMHPDLPKCLSDGIRPWANNEFMYKPEAFFTRINDQLNKKEPQPVTINYCANVLIKQSSRESPLTGCPKHAGVITGRRKDPFSGKCQYRLRNSWGAECEKYHYAWDCTESPGNFWIDADALTSNIFMVSYFDKPKK